MKHVVISGAAGFIGSHVLSHILKNTDWEVDCICSWRHKGNPARIIEDENYQANKDRVRIFTHDLSAPIPEMLVRKLSGTDYILNLAAMSHVDDSIADPVPFALNNVNVALNMLELARKIKPEVFVQFGTDEEMGPAPAGVSHKEWDSVIPSNVYSASKAAMSALAISYWRTYSVPTILTQTMNNFGERQDAEKFVPKVIRSVLRGEIMPIHGTNNIVGSRFYLHCRNCADALLFILKECDPPSYKKGAIRPERFNIVGEKELNNLEMAQMIARFIGKPLNYEIVDAHSCRPGHDLRYALSGEKLARWGWKPPVNFEESLKRTVEWTMAHPEWLGL